MSLLRKYSVPGPRYTSYPTVPYWEGTLSESAWLDGISHALKESARLDRGVAFYVHIPFCASRCAYCGCNTRLTRSRDVIEPYVRTVLSELDLYLERLGLSHGELDLAEMHLGGGTPTFLSAEELEALIGGIFERVSVRSDAELSIEADPRCTNPEQLDGLARFGFRRLSLGVQDLDADVQQLVNRIQSEDMISRVVDATREKGFTSVNFDLIYGLPRQTERSVRQTMEAVRRLRPDRIAYYSNAYVPWIKPSQRKYSDADLPSPELKRALYESGRQQLEDMGYREIGMDHFALEHDSLWAASLKGTLHRNFMGYTPRQVSPLIGLGVSSISDAWHLFAQNEKLLEPYQARVAKRELPLLRGHALDSEDLVLRRHILNLMTQFETSWGRAALRTPFLKEIAGRLAEPIADGLVEVGPAFCRITDQGRPFLRNICMAFDAHLSRSAPSAEIFSKTI